MARDLKLMIEAGINEQLRQKLWAKAANMSVDLDNIMVTRRDEENAYEQFYGSKKSLNYVKHLRQFGEVGFVMQRNNKIKSKIRNHGKKGIMVGYAKQSKAKHSRHLQNVQP